MKGLHVLYFGGCQKVKYEGEQNNLGEEKKRKGFYIGRSIDKREKWPFVILLVRCI
jgi:hypothetical protein